MEITQGVIDAHAQLVEMNAKTKAAIAAFYLRRRQRSVSAPLPRLVQVVPKGRNFFHLVDAYTDKVIGFRTGHRAACAAARDLERGAA
ncbi:hypothetical protein [Metapseudomonas resinovorans]|uniref:hypothetical protein n=1 Tax=Metapseudomonas resinovorans TaxID=53412 RepID=UPI0003FC612F|nr:hypothetical protein [Pseudomonas resinovorans]